MPVTIHLQKFSATFGCSKVFLNWKPTFFSTQSSSVQQFILHRACEEKFLKIDGNYFQDFNIYLG